MLLDPIPQSLPVHFFGSRPQPPTSRTNTWAVACEYCRYWIWIRQLLGVYITAIPRDISAIECEYVSYWAWIRQPLSVNTSSIEEYVSYWVCIFSYSAWHFSYRMRICQLVSVNTAAVECEYVEYWGIRQLLNVNMSGIQWEYGSRWVWIRRVLRNMSFSKCE